MSKARVTPRMIEALVRMLAARGRLVISFGWMWTVHGPEGDAWRTYNHVVSALVRRGWIEVSKRALSKITKMEHVIEYRLTADGRRVAKEHAARASRQRAGEPHEPGKSSPAGGASVAVSLDTYPARRPAGRPSAAAGNP